MNSRGARLGSCLVVSSEKAVRRVWVKARALDESTMMVTASVVDSPILMVWVLRWKEDGSVLVILAMVDVARGKSKKRGMLLYSQPT